MNATIEQPEAQIATDAEAHPWPAPVSHVIFQSDKKFMASVALDRAMSEFKHIGDYRDYARTCFRLQFKSFGVSPWRIIDTYLFDEDTAWVTATRPALTLI